MQTGALTTILYSSSMLLVFPSSVRSLSRLCFITITSFYKDTFEKITERTPILKCVFFIKIR